MNTTSDVRDFLAKQLAELANSDATPEEQAMTLERAKATALVANSYIGVVKAELEAIRVMDETGRLSSAIEAPQQARRLTAV